MQNVSKISYAGVLLFLAALSLFRPAMPFSMDIKDEKSEFFKTFPLTVGVWQGTDMEPDEKTLEILETRNVLSRDYANPAGEKVHLLLVSSRKDRRVAHPPEVCYTGANFNLMNQRESEIIWNDEPVRFKEFEAVNERNPNQRDEVLYLYKVGDRFTSNYYAQQIQFAMDRLTRGNSEVLLIRVSGPNEDVRRRFLREILPLLTTSR